MIIKITKITKQKKRERYNIFIDDEYSFSVSDITMIDCGLYTGMELEDHEIDKIKTFDDDKKALLSGIDIASRRLHSEKELRTKLFRRDFSEATINNTISKCKEFGYINDEHFARCFIQDSIAYKQHGIEKIIQKLYEKGIKKETIELLREELLNEKSEAEKALRIAEKKINTLKNQPYQKQKEKLYRHLISKGFSYDIVGDTVNTITGGN